MMSKKQGIILDDQTSFTPSYFCQRPLLVVDLLDKPFVILSNFSYIAYSLAFRACASSSVYLHKRDFLIGC